MSSGMEWRKLDWPLVDEGESDEVVWTVAREALCAFLRRDGSNGW